MKKKALTLTSVIILMLIINSVAWAITGNDLQSVVSSEDAEIVSQYLNSNTDYATITEASLDSDDEIIYEAVVIGPNGEEYIIIVVNGTVHVMKK